MSNNINSSGGDDHAIQIWEAKKERIELMQQKISALPTILCPTAGSDSCCIFRVPRTLVEINGRAYEPHVVSVGPYHRGAAHLEMIQEQKWRFLGSLLTRTEKKGVKLEDYLRTVRKLETRARESYSENIHIGTDEFVEMLVLDGCFIIELFRKFGEVVPFDTDDPILSMGWVYSFFLRDLIRLENQIPFFILECLFDLTSEKTIPSLSSLVIKFFNNVFQRPLDLISKFENHTGKHLLDFLRSTYIPPGQDESRNGNNGNTPTHVIHNISKLRHAGIRLKAGDDESFLAIKFKHGVIKMPPITIDDFMSAFLYNCVAYEQCHRGYSKHMTTYATLLDSLINTSRDVEYLSECNIIENYFGTEAELAKFINNLGKEVTLDLGESYLAKVFIEVNEYYRSAWHVTWASFKYTYFKTPWLFISAVAAFVLLVVTILQTLYTIFPYYNKG